MSEVTLSIGGRDYTVGCAEGEEAHVTRLGETVDAKLRQLGSNLTARDAQNLLFAALLLADEVHEQGGAASETAEREDEIERLRTARQDAEVEAAAARTEIEALRQELSDLKEQPTADPAAGDLFGDPDLAPALERFADLLENCADKLESKATTH